MPAKTIWHDFLRYRGRIQHFTFLNRKYLAYFALLAGWIWFCFWLYTHAIFPKWRPSKAAEDEIVRMDDLAAPIAFTWGSATPIAGLAFDSLYAEAGHLDSTRELILVQGFYFRDESATDEGRLDLVRRRVSKVIRLLNVNRKRAVIAYLPQEINADVRANPFIATRLEKIKEEDVLSYTGDTAQICFPIADSIVLPALSMEALDVWGERQFNSNPGKINIVGTADGTGIAESSDVAFERASLIKNRWAAKGWDENRFQLNTGQLNSPNPLRNRCVLIYFEQAH